VAINYAETDRFIYVIYLMGYSYSYRHGDGHGH